MSSTTRRRFSPATLAGAALTVLVALVLALLVPLSAQATPQTITGSVTRPGGGPAATVPLELYWWNGSAFTQIDAGTTTSAGTFSFSTAHSGNFTLHFGATPTSYSQFYGGEASLTTSGGFEADSGNGPRTTYLTVVLAASGSITGTVKKSGGSALKSYLVRAAVQSDDGSWSVVRTAKTASSGKYSLTGLEPGSYLLEALDPAGAASGYVPMFSGGVADAASASAVGVTAGHTTTYNFTVPAAGRISGVVTGLHGGLTEPVAGVVVTPYLLTGPSGSFTGAHVAAGSPAVTSATGAYTVGGLAPGSYALEFAPRTTSPLPASGTVYGRTFLGSAATATASTAVTVASGSQLAGRNIQLVGGATLEGEVLDSALLPTQVSIPFIRVTVDHPGSTPDAPGVSAQTTVADATGHFSFTGLGAGAWVLYIGSTSDSDATDGVTEDTSWKRATRTLQLGPLAAGEDRTERPSVQNKDPLGLHPSVQPGITLGGPLVVGSEIAADPGTWNGDATATTHYQWLRFGVPIPGATEQSYTVAPGDYTKKLSVRVTVYDSEYGSGTATSDETAVVAAGTIQSVTAPTVSGTLSVGSTLTAKPGTWSVADIAFQYQWQVSSDQSNWLPLFNENDSTHIITAYDLNAGPWIRVAVTGTRLGYGGVASASSSAQTVLGTQKILTPPKLITTATTYSITQGTYAPGPQPGGWTWTIIGADNSLNVQFGGTISRAAVAGKYVSVVADRGVQGFVSIANPRILVQKGVALSTSDSLAVAGTPVVGSPLSAPSPTWMPTADGTGYQWQNQVGGTWKNIAGATASDYVPLAADLGHPIRLMLSPHTTGFATPTITSPATAAVGQGAAPVQTGAAAFTGTAGINQTISVTPGTWSPAAASFGYLWKSSTDGGVTFTPIAGGTQPALVVPESTLGAELWVDITANLPGHPSTTSSVDVATVTSGVFHSITAPKVTKNGTILSVTDGTWSPVPTSISYHWWMYDDDGSLHTISLDPTTDLAGWGATTRRIVVSVTAIKAGVSSTSTAQLPAQTGTMTPDGPTAPTASSVSVGATLTAPVVTWTNVSSPQRSWAWQYKSGATWKTVAGQTASTFVPGPTLAGLPVRVVETAHATGYTTASTTSLATAALAAGAAPTAGSGGNAASVSGPPVISGTLTALPGTWSRSGLTYGYAWQSSADGTTGWTPVSGATKATYLVAPALLGKHLRAVITATAPGYLPGSTTVTVGVLGAGNLASVGVPKVMKSGSTYTVTAHWNVAPTSISYDWGVYDAASDQFVSALATTTPSFTPASADKAKAIQVSITPGKANYNSTVITVVVHPGPKIMPLDPLTVSGNPIIGSTLTANPPSAWSTSSLSLDYRWRRSGVTISGATTGSYTPVAADLGKMLTVDFLPASAGFAPSTYTVSAGRVLSDVIPTATVEPKVSGIPKVDSVLTATTGTWSVSGLSFSWQWMHGSGSGSAIPGANSASYAVPARYVDQEIWARVTASRANYQQGHASSGARTVLEGDFLSANPATIPATVKLGVPIHPVYGSWNFPANLTYQWYYDDPNDGEGFLFILGEQGPTYTPSAADGLQPGWSLRLSVDGTRAGHPGNGFHVETLIVP